MSSKEYPSRPLVGAGAVVHRGGRVLLIKRRFEPNRGKWSLPGGLVGLGETAHDAAVREVLEETGLRVEIEGLIDVGSDVHRDSRSRVRYHFILVDFSAIPSGGRLELNEESSASGWFTRGETHDLSMSRGTRGVLERFFELQSARSSLPTRRKAEKRPGKESYCFSLFPLSHHSR